MSLSSWLSWPNSHSHPWRGQRPNPASRPKKARLFLEQLESRVTPSFGLSTLGIFNVANGGNPEAGLIMDSSGNLYGTAINGGVDGDGTVFELARGNGALTALASFNYANGADPQAALLMDSSGNLYGTTESGGADSQGTVFELAQGSSTITALASFNGSNGANPQAGLIMDSSGNLYGTTAFGGGSSDGTVFELAKGSSTITTLASFNGSDGEVPNGVIMNSSGNLYGTAQGGGANSDGTVFELAKGSSTITTLASFNGTNGDNPLGGLIMNSSGNLYGTAEYGGADDRGAVFELASGSSTITTLASVNGSTNGANPQGALIMDTSGNLYGTTVGGGANGSGTVFELAKGSKTITALTSFTFSTGESPLAGLIMDNSGNFYGTAWAGGEAFEDSSEGDGTVFELLAHTPALSWSTPAAITYGTALSSTQLDASAADSVSGAAVAGTFVYTPAAGTILRAGNQTLSVTFTPANTTAYSTITTRVALVVNQATSVLTWNTPAPIAGGTALSSVQLDATAASSNTGSPVSGTFVYTPPAGTIVGRGTTLLNVIFTPTDAIDYTTATASVTQVVGPSAGLSTLAFFNGANGANPQAALIMDSSGNLYGTAGDGGADGDGTIFELANGSGTLTTLASFNGTNGAYPEAGLILDSSGNLYGTAYGGGANGDGTVFELAAGSGAITPLASFNGTNGACPEAGLIMDSGDNLYGTTDQGGPTWNPSAAVYGYGTVFELAKVGSTYSSTITTLAAFNGTNGEVPRDALIMDGNRNLYGTTEAGGPTWNPGAGVYGYGTVFELASESGTFTTLASFNGSNGDNPTGIIMDSNGNLYGAAYGGGAGGDGTVFELAAGSGGIIPLASFNGSDGATPLAGLIMDGSRNLYGTTVDGGANGDGSVFELANGSGTISTLASFNPSTNSGFEPAGGLVMDSSGNLYGTTSSGGVGSTGVGIVFELLPHTPALSWSTPAAITYGTALSSTQLDASAADSGTGAAVAGTYVYTPAAGAILQGGWQTLSVTFTPTDTTDYSPITTRVALDVTQAKPVLAWNSPAPIPYGTPLSSTQLDATAANPNSGSAASGTFVYTAPAGTILDRGSSTLTVAFTPADSTDYTTAQATVTLVVTPSYSVDDVAFNGSNGADPLGGLIMDGSGNFYGTTNRGGAHGDGTVFELAKGSSTITTLAAFNGTEPNGGLIMDSSGNLYGTTWDGGASSDGTDFELAKGSSTITALASFNGSNGSEPVAGLIMDSSGNFYGTTAYGGAHGDGTVFELAKGSSTITTLASFNGSNGSDPFAGLIMDSSGNLYGTTDEGGAHGDGTVFELAKGSSTITLLASFNGANGQYPQAGLIMDDSGNLYGTTSVGGASGDGTVFEVGAGRGFITTMVSFGGSNGVYPSGLIMDSSGNLYGTTSEGGVGYNGVAGTGDGNVFGLPAAATPSFQVSGFPSSTSAGSPQTFTITIQNADGTTDTGYTGTVHFTSNDPQAVLPADYTFTAANAGVYTFAAVLKTAGTRFITAGDTASWLVTGRATTTVTAAAASILVITGPSSVTPGAAFSITVTAYDAYGNVATGYTGTIHFSSTDSTATLPANYTFNASDEGTYTFSALVLKKKGNQSIAATDTLFSSITGSVSVDVS